jgi:hypothetical protein
MTPHTKVERGKMVMLISSLAVEATSGHDGVHVVGVCDHTATHPGDSLFNYFLSVTEGTFYFDAASGETFTEADEGSPVYVVDSHTVSKDKTFQTVAGVVRQVDGFGVAVQMQSKTAQAIIQKDMLIED